MFWRGVGGLVLCIALFPVIRLFCKRVSLVLRLKNADPQLRSDIADTAKELLCEKPYRLLTGVFSPKYSDRENIAGTQCAHLVWLAYAYYGYDIDSDRGLIVTPKDISESDLLETVQSFGRS